MPDFTRVIDLAYQRILGRPADPGGLQAYNRAMNSGLTEAQMRESLLRSPEYADKNPGTGPLSAAVEAASTKKKAKKKTTRRRG
jgi:hypothetical protein